MLDIRINRLFVRDFMCTFASRNRTIMNTSCESTSTLELRELSLAASAAIGRCWQSTDWPTKMFVTGFCALLALACPLRELNLGLCETLALV